MWGFIVAVFWGCKLLTSAFFFLTIVCSLDILLMTVIFWSAAICQGSLKVTFCYVIEKLM